MKRLMPFLAALALALGLSACGSGGLDLTPGGRQEDGSGARYGALGDALSTEWFDFTVESARSGAQYGNCAADGGRQLVVAALTLKNTCGAAVEMWEDDFVLLWDDPGGDGGIAVPLPAGLEPGQFPDRYTLGAGETKSGELVFEAPAGVEEFTIGFQEIYADEENPDSETGIEGRTFFVTFRPGEAE